MSDIAFGDSVERVWAHDAPFGDWRYIRGRVKDSLEKRLVLSRHLFPGVEVFLSRRQALGGQAAGRVLEHPFSRAVVFAMTRHLKHAWTVITAEQVEHYLHQWNHLVEQGWTGGQIPVLSPLLEEVDVDAPVHPIRLWTGAAQDRDLMGITPAAFLHNSPGFVFQSPSAEDSEQLRRGIALLRELLPSLTPSILRHIDVIALVGTQRTSGGAGTAASSLSTDPFISSSSDTSPGVVFLNPKVLANPWYIAESILHEGLHCKLYDVMSTHNLFRPNYTHADAALISPLWHSTSAPWDVQRSLFGMHVYAHLALFFGRAAERMRELVPRYGPMHVRDVRLSLQRALDRAYFLGAKLSEVGAQDLGPAGHLLLMRLQEMIRVLDGQDTSGEARGSDVSQRIIGDLYSRHTLALERILTHWTAFSSHVSDQRVSALLTGLAEGDALLAHHASSIRPEASLMASVVGEDTMRALIDCRKQVSDRFVSGGLLSNIDAVRDSISRSGRLFARTNINVELNP